MCEMQKVSLLMRYQKNPALWLPEMTRSAPYRISSNSGTADTLSSTLQHSLMVFSYICQRASGTQSQHWRGLALRVNHHMHDQTSSAHNKPVQKPVPYARVRPCQTPQRLCHSPPPASTVNVLSRWTTRAAAPARDCTQSSGHGHVVALCFVASFALVSFTSSLG